MTARLDGLTHREADWTGLRVLVAGLGVSGFAATDALLERGAQVIAVDAADPGTHAALGERARILDILGADLRFGEAHVTSLPEEELDLVVTSPGWPPHQPLLAAAAARGIPIWGEVELAWRLRSAEGAAPWLCITGTNGKTTTVQMLTSMLRAAGLRAMSVGNVGTPILEAIMDPTPHDVLAVELSSFQLHWSDSIRPQASVCLNVAPDHVDWHGSYEEYLRAKGKVYAGTEVACVYNEQDPQTRTLVEDADVQEGCRAIGFTLGLPAPSMIGVVDDVLADRAFVAERRTSAAELATLDDVRGDAPTVAPHQVANALAAAALARALRARLAPDDVAVLHLDDLYEGWSGLDGVWDRLAAWVLDPLAAGRPGRYRRYDWELEGWAEWHDVPVPQVLVVEGCGSAPRSAAPLSALAVWVEAPADVRLARGLSRDGEALRQHWLDWMVSEAAHFALEGTRDRADVRVDT